MLIRSAAYVLAAARKASAEEALEARLASRLAGLFDEVANEMLRQIERSVSAEVRAEVAERISRWDLARAMDPDSQEAARLGTLRAESLILEAGRAVSDPGVSATTADLIRERMFVASDEIMEAMTGDVVQVLAEAAEDGLSEAATARRLGDVLQGIRDSRLRSIARTEINSAANQAATIRYVELGVEEHEWVDSADDRVRASHRLVNGEIVAIGQLFSNGLEFPGDRRGPISEWISCRCTTVPRV